MRQHPRRGFTLTEMMVVIGIIILVTAVSLPIIQPMFEGKTLASGIIVIQSAIQKAMTEAARTGEIYYVSFNTIKPFEHMLVIYAGEEPDAWGDAWNDSTRRKVMVVGRPILMTKGAKLLCVTKDMYEYDGTKDPSGVLKVINDSFGKESYLKITPGGEIIPMHQEANDNGRISLLETGATTVINTDINGEDTLVVGVEGFTYEDKNDLSKFRHININLMTGELFEEFD
ncbi:MAG: type II secretion system protein [Planctomycetes bacterium]|nr:type II secretion system protein [Planctomycetota bacterium]